MVLPKPGTPSQDGIRNEVRRKLRTTDLLILLRITLLTGTHLPQGTPLIHTAVVAVIPINFNGMIAHLFDIFNLKMLDGLHKKERSVVGIHASVAAPAGYTGTIFAQAKQRILRMMSI